jgi:hypothetical protein
MRGQTQDERYEAYVKWCESIKVRPATFEVWVMLAR